MTNARRPTKSRTESGFKYANKSAGQPQLAPIFKALKKILEPYEKGTLKVRGDGYSQFHIWSEKEVDLEGKKRKEIYFAGLLIQKGYVGFYYMPVYAEPEMSDFFQPELLKCLKGKSCFHIKKLDDQLESQISDALEEGLELYKKRGWL